MAYGFVPIIHIVAAVLAVIELGLTAYLASVAQTPWGNFSPSQVNFMIFNSVWSLLVLAYVGVTPLYAAHLFHKLASLALEALTMLFWFAGSIALAVLVGPGCGRGSWCGSAQAAIAFGFILWYALPRREPRSLGANSSVGPSLSCSSCSTPSRRCAPGATAPERTRTSPPPTPASKRPTRAWAGEEPVGAHRIRQRYGRGWDDGPLAPVALWCLRSLEFGEYPPDWMAPWTWPGTHVFGRDGTLGRRTRHRPFSYNLMIHIPLLWVPLQSQVPTRRSI